MRGSSAKELRKVAERVAKGSGRDVSEVYREMKREYAKWLKRGREVKSDG